jgi:hypothetical protein
MCVGFTIRTSKTNIEMRECLRVLKIYASVEDLKYAGWMSSSSMIFTPSLIKTDQFCHEILRLI